jgi:hypothetical protein
VVLVAGQAVDRVGDHDVGFAAPESTAQFVESLALQHRAALGILDAAHYAPTVLGRDFQARALLRLERSSVALLRVRRDSRVDDRPHTPLPFRNPSAAIIRIEDG